MVKAQHDAEHEASKATSACTHGGSVYGKWGSSPLNWGRRKASELALFERMMHAPQISAVHNKELRRYYREADAEKRFEALVQKWHDETGHISATARILSNQNYLAIVALGYQAIPQILRRLREIPEPWFPALTAITRENPVDPQDVGTYQRMRDAWLAWGEKRGHL